MECKNCHNRFRADQIDLAKNCPVCGLRDWSDVRQFNTMFKTFVGPVEEEASVAYLRPETCQSIFTNFRLVQQATRKKLPFGIAQIGKAFRNEITTGNFIFRLRELEQMELEYFVRPGEDEAAFEQLAADQPGLAGVPGRQPGDACTSTSTRTRTAPSTPSARWTSSTTSPSGASELWGLANRTDYDLTQHMKASGEELDYFDEETKEHVVPYVVEPSLGVDRAMLVFLLEAYEEEQDKEGLRTILRLHPRLAPVKAAVLPLVRRDERLVALAQRIYADLRPEMPVQYDETASVGRRYRRQDEIGTPWCLTVDSQSLEDGTVTIRDRDSMAQERIPADGVTAEMQRRLRAPLAAPRLTQATPRLRPGRAPGHGDPPRASVRRASPKTPPAVPGPPGASCPAGPGPAPVRGSPAGPPGVAVAWGTDST